jgi:hypothetical protein
MNSLSIPLTQTNRARGLLVALGLMLVVALLIPQLTWADHSSTDAIQFDVVAASPGASDAASSPSSVASCDGSSDLNADEEEACDWFSALSESYSAGELEYNAPGR